jgi:hypothetical protein
MTALEEKGENLHVRLSAGELAALRELAEARGERVSSLVRVLILEAVARERVASRTVAVRKVHRETHEQLGAIREALAESRKPTRAQCNAARRAVQDLEDLATLDVVAPARAACATLDRLLGELPAVEPKKGAALLERAHRALGDEVVAWVGRIEKGEL